MALPDELCLDVDDHRVTAHIRRRSAVLSPHTGRELAELHGVVTTTDEQTHAWLSETLPGLDARSLSACDASGERAGRWIASWNSYSVNAGAHTYSIILREAEELSLESLQVGELELYPYEYREKVVGDGLAVWAKLVGTEEDVLRLRRLVNAHEVLPVVRRGIQNEPRAMRLALAEWSHFEDRIKYRLVLMDAGLDSALTGELTMVEEENSRAALTFYANFVDRLTDHLIQKGVLDEAEVAAMRAAAGAEPGVARHDLWRVPDIDAL